VKNGVPFDVAFAVDDPVRLAMSLRFSQFAGHKIDIENLTIVEEDRG
jgi:hypothetical protein